MPHGRGLPSGERPSRPRRGHDRRAVQPRSCPPGGRRRPSKARCRRQRILRVCASRPCPMAGDCPAASVLPSRPSQVPRPPGCARAAPLARSTREGGRGGLGRAGRSSRSGAQRRTGTPSARVGGALLRGGRTQTRRVCKSAPFSLPVVGLAPVHPAARWGPDGRSLGSEGGKLTTLFPAI